MRFILKKVLRKLYHLISFLSLLIIFIPQVNAESQPGWANYTDLTANGQVYLYDCYGSDCSSGSSVSATHYYSTSLYNGNSLDAVTFNSMTFGTSGGYLTFTTNAYSSKILYRLSAYICANNNYFTTSYLNYDLYALGNSLDLTRSNGHLVSNYFSGTSVNTQPFTDMGSFASCFSRNYIMQTDTNGRYFGISIYRNGNTSPSGAITWIGYTLEPLGYVDNLTSSDIRNVINSSGLATATSVSQVNTAVQEVKQEITELNNSVDNVNDSITSEDEPTIDLSDVDTISTTPISDLVTLPASLLNSYLSAFSGTCSSYTLPLPFNHSITLPCFTISDYVGNSVANIIDMAICLFMAYEIVLLFIRIFDDITTLSDTYTNWVKRGRY